MRSIKLSSRLIIWMVNNLMIRNNFVVSCTEKCKGVFIPSVRKNILNVHKISTKFPIVLNEDAFKISGCVRYLGKSDNYLYRSRCSRKLPHISHARESWLRNGKMPWVHLRTSIIFQHNTRHFKDILIAVLNAVVSISQKQIFKKTAHD